MLVYPSSIDLSSRTLRYLSARPHAWRRKIGTRRRRLPAARQALPALAHLRCGDTHAQLAAGFRIGIATVYRCVREVIDVLTAARTHGIIDAIAAAGLRCWADKAYQGAGHPVRVPFRGRRLKRWKRRHNSSHAKIRSLVEQAMAVLKNWRLLRKFRCSTNRITAIVQAVLVLHHAPA